MIDHDEFGSLVAEVEGLRNTLFDTLVELRDELEKLRLKVEILEERIRDVNSGSDNYQMRLR